MKKLSLILTYLLLIAPSLWGATLRTSNENLPEGTVIGTYTSTRNPDHSIDICEAIGGFGWNECVNASRQTEYVIKCHGFFKGSYVYKGRVVTIDQLDGIVEQEFQKEQRREQEAQPKGWKKLLETVVMGVFWFGFIIIVIAGRLRGNTGSSHSSATAQGSRSNSTPYADRGGSSVSTESVERIASYSGRTVANIYHHSNGIQEIRLFSGRCLGTYHPSENTTKNYNGYVLGRGNILTSLIPPEEFKK